MTVIIIADVLVTNGGRGQTMNFLKALSASHAAVLVVVRRATNYDTSCDFAH